MWLGCVFIVCVFFIIIGFIFNDVYCTDLKIKKSLKEDKQRYDAELARQKQELDYEIEKEKIKNEQQIQFLEGQIEAYKNMLNK